MRYRKEITYWVRNYLREYPFRIKLLKYLHRNEYLSPADLKSFVDEKLLEGLKTAVRKIPHYHNIKIEESKHSAYEQLVRKFPIITKKDLFEKKKLFYPKRAKFMPWKLFGKTSGTTGTPLEVFRSFRSILWENAFIRRHWAWCGFKPGMRRATLRGDLVVPIDTKRPPFWFYNRHDNQLIISSRHLKKKFYEVITEELEAFSPHLMEAYPSTAFQLASHLHKNNKSIHIPYIYTGSEILYEHQRELIQEVFHTKVFDFYGMAERVALATECEIGNLHLNTDYSFVEIVDEQGKPTADYGFIVGTTYHNHLMPLVRYRLDDRSKWKKGICRCGRPFPIIHSVIGKYEQTVFDTQGNPVSPSIITFALKGLKNIQASQVVQVNQSTWEIRLVPDIGYDSRIQYKLIDNLYRLVDSNIRFQIVTVPHICRDRSGKFQWVKNEWNNARNTV